MTSGDAAQTTLTAMMCDGLGWFTPLDFKRMLLAYDRLYYLLPGELVEFEDVSGQPQVMHFPLLFQDWPSFEVLHSPLDPARRTLIETASERDLEGPGFARAVASIPTAERRYTWRVVNADGELGDGASPGLAPDQEARAHALLLNKLLLAADARGCVPISGQPYIHTLISEKYRAALQHVEATRPELLPASLKASRRLHNPVVSGLISALVSDQELEQRTDQEIFDFKHQHRDLFERYSLTVARLVRKASGLPLSDRFEEELQELIRIEVWQEKQEIEDRLRAAWQRFFKSTLSHTVGGVISVALVPSFSLEVLTLATVVGTATSVAHSALSGLMEYLDARKEARRHGLYYLMKFSR